MALQSRNGLFRADMNSTSHFLINLLENNYKMVRFCQSELLPQVVDTLKLCPCINWIKGRIRSCGVFRTFIVAFILFLAHVGQSLTLDPNNLINLHIVKYLAVKSNNHSEIINFLIMADNLLFLICKN